MHEGTTSCAVFLDFVKVFDTVDHEILLEKLNHYGIRGVVNSFFKSYLQNRKQKVEIEGSLSGIKKITCGVPQGSVLGPILFLLYINDLPTILSNAKATIFADDTSLFFKHKNPKELEHLLNSDLKAVSECLQVTLFSFQKG